MMDLPLFDDGEDRKARGVQRALDAIYEDYKAQFYAEVTRLAHRGQPFTSEDVTAVVGLPRHSHPNANNSVGALMHTMARCGIIRKTGRMVKTRNPVSNAREVREWIAR